MKYLITVVLMTCYFWSSSQDFTEYQEVSSITQKEKFDLDQIDFIENFGTESIRTVIFAGYNFNELSNNYMPLQIYRYYPVLRTYPEPYYSFENASWQIERGMEFGFRMSFKRFEGWTSGFEISTMRNLTSAEGKDGPHRFHFEGEEWRTMFKYFYAYGINNVRIQGGPLLGIGFSKNYETWVDYRYDNGTVERIDNTSDEFYKRDFTFGLSAGLTIKVFQAIDLSAQWSLYRINFSPRIYTGTITPRNPYNFYNDNWIQSLSFTIGYAVFTED